MADTVTTNLDQLEAKLDRGIARAKRSMAAALILGLIVIAALATYFTFLGGMVREAAEPQAIAQYAAVQIQEQIPEIRDRLLAVAEQEAPGIADTLIDRALAEGVPFLRTQAQDHLKAALAIQLDEMQTQLVATVRERLSEDPAMREMIMHLETEEGQQALEEALYQSIDSALTADENLADLVAYEETLAGVDERLRMLSEGELEDIPVDQQYLYKLVAILRELSRRMHEQGPEMPLSPPTEPIVPEEAEAVSPE
jgi:hypothetical protein